ncbi:centrosomal protein of 41 kDa-like [Tachypleus tridentatus]|uniref:centrosomal protein of 41 kDa-like n=1 Tax=Tachypleus tridentatus TaxID=6853 RepID=UPI003FD26730
MSSMARLAYGYKKKLDKDAVLNKKVPENPRYRCVRPVVDSGSSVRRYVGRMQEIYKNVKYKRGEIFKRIKLSTFVTLVIEVAKELQQQTREDNGEYSDVTLARGETNYRNSPGVQQYSSAQSEVSDLDTTRSTFQSVISGVGELDLRKGVKNSPEYNPVSLDEASLPYVLLDVRDRDAYKECHIIIAKNYPYTMLSRSCNYETKELLDFKNRPCKIIVIYDEDETIAPNVASTLVQRGYDNVFLLSGGLKLAALKFPQGLITGTLPKSCISQKSSPVKKRVTLSARSSVSNSEPSTLKLNSLHQLGHSTKNHLTSADILLFSFIW